MQDGWLTFNRVEARTASAVFERLFPADVLGPGAIEIGVVTYVDRALAGAYAELVETYRLGLYAINQAARKHGGVDFAEFPAADQDALIGKLQSGALPEFRVPNQEEFFRLLL